MHSGKPSPEPCWRCVLVPCCRCSQAFYKRDADLGPAVAFLYSGPAINVLAIVLTAKVLGSELGIARAIDGTVVLSGNASSPEKIKTILQHLN